MESLTQICLEDHPIHWHCFTGPQSIFDYATTFFRNIVFGVTPFILTSRYLDIRNLLIINATGFFVLESDASYIKVPGKEPIPSVVNCVAEEISQITGRSLADVISFTTANTCRIYGKERYTEDLNNCKVLTLCPYQK